VDQVHQRRLLGLRTSLNVDRWVPDRWLRLNLANRFSASKRGHSSSIRRSRQLALVGGGAGDSPEFEFSWATVVGFQWGLLLLDHSNEGNVIMLTIIGGERQRGPAMVRQLGGCLATVRAAFGKASALRTCAKACSTSLIAPRPTNCSKQWQKTRIWWLPRVWRVLDLRPKIHTICGAIYRGF
jgi:hypothetical protein